jgi:hypothetical protein
MLKLGSKPKAIGTAVRCPSCRYPNLGISIWCERCRTPLEWTGQAPASHPSVPSAVVAPEPPDPPDPPSPQPIPSRRRPAGAMPVFALPRLAMPAIAWPRLTMPRLSAPSWSLPRVPRIAWMVAVVLVVLLVPLAFVLLPSSRTTAARQTAPGHLPATNGAAPDGTPIAAAIPGVEAKTGLHYSATKCATSPACLTLASQAVGQDAAAVVFSTAGPAGRECVGYVYRAGGRWQFLDAVCALPGQLSPLVGHDATVHVPGNCANVRDGASLKAGVVACLHDGTVVHIDGGPTYADGRLWWHEKHGWIAHDFLTGP